MLQLAEGKAHAFVYAGQACMKWDTCAPEAIITAVGGKLTDVYGKYYSYHKDADYRNRGGVFATRNRADHETIVSKMPDDVKRALV